MIGVRTHRGDGTLFVSAWLRTGANQSQAASVLTEVPSPFSLRGAPCIQGVKSRLALAPRQLATPHTLVWRALGISCLGCCPFCCSCHLLVGLGGVLARPRPTLSYPVGGTYIMGSLAPTWERSDVGEGRFFLRVGLRPLAYRYLPHLSGRWLPFGALLWSCAAACHSCFVGSLCDVVCAVFPRGWVFGLFGPGGNVSPRPHCGLPPTP